MSDFLLMNIFKQQQRHRSANNAYSLNIFLFKSSTLMSLALDFLLD